MCFGSRYTLQQLLDLKLKLNDTEIAVVKQTKYLGVILNPTLSFSNHAEYVRSKAASQLRMLGQIRSLVSESTSLNMYKALISPLFDYASPVYDCLNMQDSYKLQKVQNCALQIITRSGRSEHIVDLHNKLNMHYLVDRRHISTLCHVYKCLQGTAPVTNSSMITKVFETHSRLRRTMANENLAIPAYK